MTKFCTTGRAAALAWIMVATSAAAGAQRQLQSAAPVDGAWRQFFENERLVAYQQGAREQAGGIVAVWVLFEYRQEQQSPSSTRRYLSQIGQQEVDCRGGRSRTVAFSWRGGHMGKGALVYTASSPRPWEPTVPSSIGDALATAVCPQLLLSLPQLARVASEANKSLPMMIDSETELTNVGVAPGTLVYNYRLLTVLASDVTAEQLRDRLRPSAVRQACSTPETRDGVLMRGITMRFSYRATDGTYIGAFNVAASDCSPM